MQPSWAASLLEKLPRAAAAEVLEKRTFRAAVDADWKLSREYGITGVPTFVAGHRGVVGAQPYEVIERLVKQAKAEEAAQDPAAGDDDD